MVLKEKHLWFHKDEGENSTWNISVFPSLQKYSNTKQHYFSFVCSVGYCFSCFQMRLRDIVLSWLEDHKQKKLRTAGTWTQRNRSGNWLFKEPALCKWWVLAQRWLAAPETTGIKKFKIIWFLSNVIGIKRRKKLQFR